MTLRIAGFVAPDHVITSETHHCKAGSDLASELTRTRVPDNHAPKRGVRLKQHTVVFNTADWSRLAVRQEITTEEATVRSELVQSIQGFRRPEAVRTSAREDRIRVPRR